MYSIPEKWFHKRKDMYEDLYLEALYTMTDTYRKIALLDLKTGISHNVKADREELEYMNFLGIKGKMGIPYDKWIKRISKELIHPDYREEFNELFNVESLRESIKSGKIRQTMIYQCRKRIGGEYHWVQAEYVAYGQKEVSSEILFCIRDINDKWVAVEKERRELEKAFRKAERENQTKTDFLQIFAEDIRVSVSTIHSMNRNAIQMMDSGQLDASRRYLTMMNRVVTYLLPLLTDLVDTTYLQRRGVTLVYECFDMHHLIETCKAHCHDLVQDRHISLMWVGELRGFYLGDEDRIRLVILNVLDNAVKFNRPDGSVKISLEMLAGIGATDIFIICVSDSGVGISKEQQQCLFEPFHRRLHKETDRHPGISGTQGLGIGLNVAKSILDAMGGSIRIESEPGAGTVVTIQFALQRAQGAALGSRVPCQAAAARQ